MIPTMTQFQKSSEILNERQKLTRMTTGDADLDSLLGGGIEPGQFYLFYGDKDSGVDILIHQILVNSLLPPERFGLGGKCVYSNCGNYRLEKTMLDTGLLCHLVKAAKLKTDKALDSIYTICSFSEEQQETVFKDIQDLIRKDDEIRLVVVHNIAKLFTTNRHGGERIKRLQKAVFQLWRVCAENNLAFVASCRPAKNSRGAPQPEGGGYLSHKATVIVYLRRLRKGYTSAHLIEHSNRAPRRITLKSGLGGDPLGRITPPFRTLFQPRRDGQP